MLLTIRAAAPTRGPTASSNAFPAWGPRRRTRTTEGSGRGEIARVRGCRAQQQRGEQDDGPLEAQAGVLCEDKPDERVGESGNPDEKRHARSCTRDGEQKGPEHGVEGDRGLPE